MVQKYFYATFNISLNIVRKLLLWNIYLNMTSPKKSLKISAHRLNSSVNLQHGNTNRNACGPGARRFEISLRVVLVSSAVSMSFSLVLLKFSSTCKTLGCFFRPNTDVWNSFFPKILFPVADFPAPPLPIKTILISVNTPVSLNVVLLNITVSDNTNCPVKTNYGFLVFFTTPAGLAMILSIVWSRIFCCFLVIRNWKIE